MGIIKELDDLGNWTGTLDLDHLAFRPLSPYLHKEREEKIKRVFDMLGYAREVCNLDDQIGSADI